MYNNNPYGQMMPGGGGFPGGQMPGAPQGQMMGGYPGGFPGQMPPNPFRVDEATLRRVGDQVFARYDTSGTGKVPNYMLNRMLEEVCYLCGTQQMYQGDGSTYLRTFDVNSDGTLV